MLVLMMLCDSVQHYVAWLVSLAYHHTTYNVGCHSRYDSDDVGHHDDEVMIMFDDDDDDDEDEDEER